MRHPIAVFAPMSHRVFNFSAGPATLPEPVLRQAQAELLDWRGMGASVAEISHRSAPFIELAAQHGKDIFTEKPIALDLDATDRALAAVEAAGVRLQVGFQRRFDRDYMIAKEAIARGDIGRIEMIHDVMRDPEPPPADYIRRSGGLYRDMTIHNFDSVCWLMGEEPTEVFATASAIVSDVIRDAGDIDTSILTFRFPSGVHLGVLQGVREPV